MLLTPLPAADANMALVHRDDPDALDEAVSRITGYGVPALLMLAGDAEPLGAALGDEWSHVGAMPIMSRPLAGSAPDPRVRELTADEVDVATELMAQAYGIAEDVARFFAANVLAESTAMRGHVLEQDGVPVSFVASHVQGDTMSVWCMSTPPAHARHGYGRALLGAVQAIAHATGAETGLLGATEAGYPLYERMGWETFEKWQVHLNGASEQFG